MPHYKDGTGAKVGDVVKGIGYNVKDENGQLKEIIGTVVGITPGSMSCNIQVAHIVTRQVDADFASWQAMYDFFEQKGVTGCGAEGGTDNKWVVAKVCLEYGQCDHFEKIV
jgi:hypothetical protein